ncbi:MAG: tRNA pseudouridine(38-40) synthase TruA [Pseudomonadota bacterium]
MSLIMPRYRLTIEYDGGSFVGWQRQKNGESVQSAVEDAFGKFTGQTPTIFSAGRTDAGVHALAMTAHVDLDKDFSADVVRDALNFHLRPAAISILDTQIVSPEFHARFSCVERRYQYRIANRRPPLALDAGRLWQVPQILDAEAMHRAGKALEGKHDFTTFRAAACQSNSPIRTLTKISVSRYDEEVVIACAAPSFLHHQVRSIAGALVEVGKGRWREQDLGDALDAKNRARCGPVAPAHGLYFVKAIYEKS